MTNGRILIVCLGNICRSPMAEEILREKSKSKGLNVVVDSAGTESYHIGEPPDSRAVKTAGKYGIDISQLRARQFSINDFDLFDSIYIMDRTVLADVISLSRNKNDNKKVKLFLEVAGNSSMKEVPDPWYGEMADFDRVFKMLNDACEKIADLIFKEATSSRRK